MPSFLYAFRCFRFRLVGANNGTIRKEQQHSSSCRAICCPLIAIYQGQKKDCERKGNENKRGGQTIVKKSIAGKQEAKKIGNLTPLYISGMDQKRGDQGRDIDTARGLDRTPRTFSRRKAQK